MFLNIKNVLGLVNIFALQIIAPGATASPYQQQDGDSISRSVIVNTTAASSNPIHNGGPFAVKDNESRIEADSALKNRDTSYRFIDSRYNSALSRLKMQAADIKDYAKHNNYNQDFCFLIDMSIPSGKKRFFIYNLKKDSLENSALVSHGFGSYKPDCDDKLVFSNAPYSCKTSIGKYKVGTSYNGTYGLAFKLYGLDTSNNRAFERAIVLHSDIHIPETETYPFRIFQSAGCPAVSPAFLAVLGTYIQSSKKPILMWIYN